MSRIAAHIEGFKRTAAIAGSLLQNPGNLWKVGLMCSLDKALSGDKAARDKLLDMVDAAQHESYGEGLDAAVEVVERMKSEVVGDRAFVLAVTANALRNLRARHDASYQPFSEGR